MSEIKSQIITFSQLRSHNYQICDDRYGIAAYVLTKHRIAAGLNCPFNTDDKSSFYFVNVDNVVASRTQMLGTQIYANGQIISCGTGSSLETAENYRHLGIGVDVMMFAAKNDEYPLYLVSGISEMALPLYKKLGYYVLAFPRIMQLRNVRCLLESKGLRGNVLYLFSILINIPLSLIYKILSGESKRLLKLYQVEKVTKIPEWVDDIVLNDGHKYMEAHDHKWLQWNLDCNFRGLPRDIQSFYIIKKGNEPIGFFMTKERFREKAGGALKNVHIGSIVEWGSKDEKKLGESEIYKMALTTFSADVDIIEAATADNDTVKKMKMCGFIPHGFAHIGLKDKKKAYKDASDINLWRVRYGYADVILT